MTMETPSTRFCPPDGPARDFTCGALTFRLEAGAIRRLCFDGIEVVRLVDAPIRDADWRTLPVEETGGDCTEAAGVLRLARRFRSSDGTFDGGLTLEARATAATAEVALDLTLTARRAAVVNRAGFVLLHPLEGVTGTALRVRHPNGRASETRFPMRISPAQPVSDIAGLAHEVRGITVEIDFSGETFEMEDQRNWTDASFKTYCRPLARPRPFDLEAGAVVRQRIAITLSRAGTIPAPAAPRAPAARVRLPEILLAHEPALGGPPAGDLGDFALAGLALRVDAAAPVFDLPVVAPVTLEIIADETGDVLRVARLAAAAGLRPRRVVALPRSYLTSHQPEGPWPDSRPDALIAEARAAFPGVGIGGGMLTNFTEFNRCPPDPAAIDFATFGTTAIVHAGDDTSVLETLEALPDVLASAAALVPGRPLHLGLMAIGMRSNPYGQAVAPNPEGRRIAMAMADPRQQTPFAAAFAIAAAAAAARGGVASFCPAMAAGPLGLGPAGAPWPIRATVAALAGLGGQDVEITGGPGGLLSITGREMRLVANLTRYPAETGDRAIPPISAAIFPQSTSG